MFVRLTGIDYFVKCHYSFSIWHVKSTGLVSDLLNAFRETKWMLPILSSSSCPLLVRSFPTDPRKLTRNCIPPRNILHCRYTIPRLLSNEMVMGINNNIWWCFSYFTYADWDEETLIHIMLHWNFRQNNNHYGQSNNKGRNLSLEFLQLSKGSYFKKTCVFYNPNITQNYNELNCVVLDFFVVIQFQDCWAMKWYGKIT